MGKNIKKQLSKLVPDGYIICENMNFSKKITKCNDEYNCTLSFKFKKADKKHIMFGDQECFIDDSGIVYFSNGIAILEYKLMNWCEFNLNNSILNTDGKITISNSMIKFNDITINQINNIIEIIKEKNGSI